MSKLTEQIKSQGEALWLIERDYTGDTSTSELSVTFDSQEYRELIAELDGLVEDAYLSKYAIVQVVQSGEGE